MMPSEYGIGQIIELPVTRFAYVALPVPRTVMESAFLDPEVVTRGAMQLIVGHRQFRTIS
ncbi:MAG: hypothetical protein IPM53_00700 [Anaerolineaceae bacterium]|nr:hypothetical protein [Anaerolineaceae bacterium]